MKTPVDLNKKSTTPTLSIVRTNYPEEDNMPPSLNDRDKRDIAKYVAEELKSPFTMEPKEHYDEHTEMREVVRAFHSAGSIFTRTIMTLSAVGVIILAAIALFGKKLGIG